MEPKKTRSHHTQQAFDFFIFFSCVNESIKWLYYVQKCILEFKIFPTSPRTPNSEFGHESYNHGKFIAKKMQCANE